MRLLVFIVLLAFQTCGKFRMQADLLPSGVSNEIDFSENANMNGSGDTSIPLEPLPRVRVSISFL